METQKVAGITRLWQGLQRCFVHDYGVDSFDDSRDDCAWSILAQGFLSSVVLSGLRAVSSGLLRNLSLDSRVPEGVC